MHDFCVDCESSVRVRAFHTKGCVAACRACLRFGYGFPCTTVPGQRKIACPDCHFTFQNKDCFNYHKLEQLPNQQRKFKSICQQRYYCELCWKPVYARGARTNAVKLSRMMKIVIYAEVFIAGVCRVTSSQTA